MDPRRSGGQGVRRELTPGTPIVKKHFILVTLGVNIPSEMWVIDFYWINVVKYSYIPLGLS